MPIEGVCIALEDNALAPDPTWTRLDSTPNLVASYSIRRGRQDEREKTGTGTAIVEISDVNGYFDPTFEASPYGEAIDGRQMALALYNPVTDSWSTLFRGFADAYEYAVDPSGLVTRVTIELVDGLDYLANAEAVPGNAGHPPPAASEGDVFFEDAEVDSRIKGALLNAGWPPEMQTIFSGNVNVKETVYSPGTPFLQILQDAADAEWPGIANIYVSREGKITFHGRHARFDPEAVSASAGEDAWIFTRWKAGGSQALPAGTAQLRALSFARSRKNIINAAMALPMRSGTESTDPDPPLTEAQITGQIVKDTASILRFGVHSWSAENLITKNHKTNGTTDLQETKLFARYYRDNYKNPQTRVTQLVFRSIAPADPRAAATWALLCGVEISDTVQITLPFPGGGGFVSDEFYIEGISYDVRPLNAEYADVTLSLDVSPVGYYGADVFDDDAPPEGDAEAPTAPGSLAATGVADDQVDLTWTAASDNVAVTGYYVERDGVSITLETGLSYSDTGLLPGTTYTYRVRAVDAAGNLGPYSSTDTGTTTGTAPDTTAPTAPSNLTAIAASDTQIDLEWDAATDAVGVDDYLIERNGVQIAVVASPTLTYSDTGLTPSTTYTYRVRARDAALNVGPYTDSVDETTDAYTPPPLSALTPEVIGLKAVNDSASFTMTVSGGESTADVDPDRSDAPSGSVLLVAVADYHPGFGSVPVASVTDSLGTTYTDLTDDLPGQEDGVPGIHVFAGKLAEDFLEGDTVTVSHSGAPDRRLVALVAVDGLAASSYVDNVVVEFLLSSDPAAWELGPVTTTVAGDLGIVFGAAVNGWYDTEEAGWTLLTKPKTPGSTSVTTMQIEYKVLGAAGSYQPDGNTRNNDVGYATAGKGRQGAFVTLKPL